MQRRIGCKWLSLLLCLTILLTMGLTACSSKKEKKAEQTATSDASANNLFQQGLLPIQLFELDYKYGYINTKGEQVIPCQYNEAGHFAKNGLARVRIGDRETGKYGYINTKGEQVIPCRYNYARDFADNGLAAVYLDGNCGYINTKGEQVILCQYTSAENFASNDMALVRQAGVWCMIDTSGNTVREIDMEMHPEKIRAFDDAYLVEMDGKIGILSLAGDVLLPLSYCFIPYGS